MGDAKRNREALRQRMLAELDRWSTPASAEEERLNEELRALTFYRFARHGPRTPKCYRNRH